MKQRLIYKKNQQHVLIIIQIILTHLQISIKNRCCQLHTRLLIKKIKGDLIKCNRNTLNKHFRI